MGCYKTRRVVKSGSVLGERLVMLAGGFQRPTQFVVRLGIARSESKGPPQLALNFRMVGT